MEPRNLLPRCASGGYSGVPTRWIDAEGHTGGAVSARRPGTPRGRRPHACTDAPRTGTGRSRVCRRSRGPQAASGSPRTHADDGRVREVGQPRSTREATEQRRGTGRGGGGEKGAGQGEPAQAQRAPDPEPGKHAQRAQADTAGNKERQETTIHRTPSP